MGLSRQIGVSEKESHKLMWGWGWWLTQDQRTAEASRDRKARDKERLPLMA